LQFISSAKAKASKEKGKTTVQLKRLLLAEEEWLEKHKQRF
jgi:hypothetical protein